MLARFRQTATGLQCSLVETRRIDGKVLHELVTNLGSVPKSPSVADRIAFWRRVYETLAELANRIDAETQGKIISAVHSRIPLVTPNEQRALCARPPRQGSQKAPHLHGVDECPHRTKPKGRKLKSTLSYPRKGSPTQSAPTTSRVTSCLFSVFINLIICSVAAVLAADQCPWCAISVKAPDR
jgi:hypothetical protein